MKRRILEAIFELPRSDDELERDLGMRHQSCSPRTSEMAADGIIRESGVRRPTRSGHLAIVWVVSEPPWTPVVKRKIGQRSALALLAAAEKVHFSHQALGLDTHVGPAWVRDMAALKAAIDRCRKDLEA